MSAGYGVRVFGDIDDVPAGEWDALIAPDDLQASHRFIRLCQRSDVEHADYRHLVVHRAGRAVAVASLCRMDVSLDLLAGRPIRALVERARRWRPSFLKVQTILCGLPVSFGQSCLRVRPGEDVAHVAGLVAQEMERWAAEADADLLCFKEFTEAESQGLASLVGAGYVRAASLPFCSLPIRWNSFDDYLGNMRAGYRHQMARTLARQAEGDLVVTAEDDFGRACPLLFRMYSDVMDRAEAQLERLNLAFFTGLNSDLGVQSSALYVRQGDHVLASGILLHAPRTMTFLLAGIDYQRHRETLAYPVLVTAIVAEAIRRGVTRLELGQTSYALKGRLGAETGSRDVFLRARSPILNAVLHRTSGLLFPRHAIPDRHVFRRDGGAQPMRPRPI